jgi:phosphoglycerol transferase MdoB-like AlkP superfamily enzyme
MATGALLCLLAGQLVGMSSQYAAVYHPGSALFALGDIIFLTAPVFAWMTWRGRTRRLSLAVSMAMIAPVALVVVAGEIMGTEYLLWLVTGMYPVMAIGIAIFMLYRRNEFEGNWARQLV